MLFSHTNVLRNGPFRHLHEVAEGDLRKRRMIHLSHRIELPHTQNLSVQINPNMAILQIRIGPQCMSAFQCFMTQADLAQVGEICFAPKLPHTVTVQKLSSLQELFQSIQSKIAAANSCGLVASHADYGIFIAAHTWPQQETIADLANHLKCLSRLPASGVHCQYRFFIKSTDFDQQLRGIVVHPLNFAVV